MTSGLLDTGAAHPLECLVEGLEELLGGAGEARAWTLSPAQLVELLPRLARQLNTLDAYQLAMLGAADRHRVGDPVGAASTAGWWANATRKTKPAAHGEVGLAHRLDDSFHEPTAAGCFAGGVSVEQAAVILDAVEALPGELVGPVLRREVETHLVGLAEHHDPRELRVLGRKALEVLAPEIAEEHERQVLENEEAHAAATASFSMRPDGHGSVFGRFKIPVLAAEILGKHLAAIAAPRHQGSTTGPDLEATSAPTSRPLRLGQAFAEYLETRAATGMPKAGGIAATIVVTMTKDDLTGATNKAALLDTGEHISAGQARRLACEAGIIPAVLGSPSQVLDLGRKTRFHTEPQRTALMLRDKGCAELHCDWPPGMCHAHHPTAWSRGGNTSVKNGILLCPRHHTLAHDARYQHKTDKHGRVTFTRQQ